MQKRWVLIVPFMAVTFLISRASINSAAAFCGVIFLLLIMLKGLDMFGGIGSQKLLITVPFPKNTPLKTIPLLLGAEDGQVYRYVLRHGGKKAGGNGNETQIKYSGPIIYSSADNTFTIEGWKHTPDALHVKELY
jgi:hypothetical protein